MSRQREELAEVLGHTLGTAAVVAREPVCPARSVENLATSMALRAIRAGVTEARDQDDLGADAVQAIVNDVIKSDGIDGVLTLTFALAHIGGALVAELCEGLDIDPDPYLENLHRDELARQAAA